MSTASVELTMRGRRRSIFDRLSAKSEPGRWAGFDFEVGVSDGQPMASHHWSRTTLLYVMNGDADLRWKHRGVWRHDPIATGCVSIVKRDEVIQSALPSGPSTMMALQIDPVRLADFAPDLSYAIEASLVDVAVTRDARLSAIMSAMIGELEAGCTSGRLFAESLSIALLSCLATNYATGAPAPSGTYGLSAGQKRRLARHVYDNLAGDISVSGLSALVQMNPSTFARRFKQAFGVTPYKYVMRERVNAAKRLMAHDGMRTNQIAQELGFASQSHLLKVFRQFVGVSPRQFRDNQ